MRNGDRPVSRRSRRGAVSAEAHQRASRADEDPASVLSDDQALTSPDVDRLAGGVAGGAVLGGKIPL